MSPAFKGLLSCLLLAGLAGCAAMLDNVSTPQTMSAQGKGAVVMEVGMTGVPCAGGAVTVAKAEGDHYRAAATVNPLGITGAGFWWAELDPGEYHVVHVKCLMGTTNTILGATFLAPLKSYGRFEVRAGEVVNIGSLDLIRVGLITVNLAVRPFSDSDLEMFRRSYPNLAMRIETRLLDLRTSPNGPRQS